MVLNRPASQGYAVAGPIPQRLPPGLAGPQQGLKRAGSLKLEARVKRWELEAGMKSCKLEVRSSKGEITTRKGLFRNGYFLSGRGGW